MQRKRDTNPRVCNYIKSGRVWAFLGRLDPGLRCISLRKLREDVASVGAKRNSNFTVWSTHFNYNKSK